MALLFACVETMMGSQSPEGFRLASIYRIDATAGDNRKNDEDDYGRQ
jgi:hypothetical protein